MKRAEGDVLAEVEEVRIGGKRPVGRPRKRWSDCVMEGMNLFGVEEHVAQDRRL